MWLTNDKIDCVLPLHRTGSIAASAHPVAKKKKNNTYSSVREGMGQDGEVLRHIHEPLQNVLRLRVEHGLRRQKAKVCVGYEGPCTD